MGVPEWVKDAVFYQIFPDRFANGDPKNDPENVKAWGSKPTIKGFQGGDLRGIIQKMDYFNDLSINAIYLNPIFLSPSTHRYDTVDYYKIDPKLGTNDEFEEFLTIAHSNNIKVVLDGVFNHCSRGFFAFNDILENDADSPYLNWFHIKNLPVDAYSAGQAKDYQAWWGFKSLPKFNTDHQPVREYILQVARYWIEKGIDGWRLDVPNEINDDAFWETFRNRVKEINPEAYLVGEIWELDDRWVDDRHFDGLMNYPLRDAGIGFINGKSSATHFLEVMKNLMTIYRPENTSAMLNLLGSHDTERILTLLGKDKQKLKMAFLWLFTLPGAPTIYYGDEIGLLGGKDPDCRQAYPWGAKEIDSDLFLWVKRLIKYRNQFPSLRKGDFIPLFANDNSACVGYLRSMGGEKILVCLNGSSKKQVLKIKVNKGIFDPNQKLNNLMGEESFVVSEDGTNIQIVLNPVCGVILR
jgi:glycosidase